VSIFANDPAGRAAVARARQANRLAATASKPARKAIERVVDALDRQVASLDKQIRALVDADDGSRHLDGLLQSVPRRRPAQPRLGQGHGQAFDRRPPAGPRDQLDVVKKLAKNP